ncbi:MAG: hypothetical protein AB8G99_27265 [Planctomycetaceae bacterium]
MASYAATIREKLNIETELEKGRVGQFDVVVNGETVVSRKGGLIAKLTGKPWPEHDHVVQAIEAQLEAG